MNDQVIEALAECLDAVEQGSLTPKECLERYPDYAEELAPLIQTAFFIRKAPTVTPSPEYRQATRIRLMNRMAAAHKKARSTTTRRRRNPASLPLSRSFALGWLVIFIIVVALFSGGTVAYASGNALPGDTFYGVKTRIESARLWRADEAEAAVLHVQFANTRLMEIQVLTSLERFEDIPVAVQGFENHVSEASANLDALEKVNPGRGKEVKEQVQATISSQSDTLVSLMTIVPEEYIPALDHAIQTTGTALGKPVNLGQPQGVGPQEGPVEGTGRPENAGPKDKDDKDTGKPDDTGPKDKDDKDTGKPDDTGPKDKEDKDPNKPESVGPDSNKGGNPNK